MSDENISQEFRSKNVDETTNYFVEEIQQNDLISMTYKELCTTLNNIEHFLILVSGIIGFVSISAFASLVGILIEITSSAMG